VLPSSLQISIVTHQPDTKLLERVLRKLALAVGVARSTKVVKTVHLALIDNSENATVASRVIELGRARFADTDVHVIYLHGHANIGYGAAHNLVLHGTGADYHLVLNPDVELGPDAIESAITWLDGRPDVGALAPSVQDPSGAAEYLCKRYPAVLDLFLRGFAPNFVQRLFRRRLDRYEMRDVLGARPNEDLIGIPALSGACIFVRRAAIDATGGFDPKFFLYFEDFDWSLRLNRVTQSAYVPAVRIVHHGGGAARKGWRHVLRFTTSAVRFFNKHGWKWA